MQVIQMNIGDIKPYDRNPRKNDAAVKYVAESLKEFGWKQPIVIDKDNVIVAGHTRYKAAKKLKMKTVPVVVADDLTDEQVRAFRLVDNRTAEEAEWDFDMLSDELDGILDIDMELFGFEDEPEEEEKEREDLSEKLDDEYCLVISCEDENQLEELYNEMQDRGFACKLSTL